MDNEDFDDAELDVNDIDVTEAIRVLDGTIHDDLKVPETGKPRMLIGRVMGAVYVGPLMNLLLQKSYVAAFKRNFGYRPPMQIISPVRLAQRLVMLALRTVLRVAAPAYEKELDVRIRHVLATVLRMVGNDR